MEITEKERFLLESIECVEYLARDFDGDLYAYFQKPEKVVEYGGEGCWESMTGVCDAVKIKDELFSMVKWTDEEPTKISDLLK